ncbi:glycosyltransferase family 2 protein [Arthrobacter sp. LjRoot78]|uniref:glycosyltransferase family 2 protein n=1 Tax=Arthrobacter sp. LjRoot78 TaxID=3342338 RepID=UPI003F5088DA
MNLHVLVACHNRVQLTVQSLNGAWRSAQAAGIDISFTVYDDGSTDGTAAIVSDLPFDVSLIRGDGSAFWARSMATAEEALMNSTLLSDLDHVLWLNDDVVLDMDAINRLATCALGNPGSVVIGAMRDPDSGIVSYSGLRRSGAHPLRFDRVGPSDAVQDVETFNGNLVLVPGPVALLLGGIDGDFSHGLADIDYGLRCIRAGIRVVQAPGTYGSCPRNSPPSSTTLLREWARFTGPKGGGNFGSLRRILRKGNRNSWILYISATYVLWWMREVQRRFKSQITAK